MPINHTERGFATYADFTDTYGVQVRVRESSSATHEAVWIFIDSGGGAHAGAAHLNAEQAQVVVAALQEWLASVKE